MNRERTREVLVKLGIPIEAEDVSGIEIHRTICPGGILSFMETERWRLSTGGGIAGNSDQVWLAPFVRRTPPLADKPYEPRGPYWNKAQLEKALRAWRRGE
jgi:hypothetical protein